MKISVENHRGKVRLRFTVDGERFSFSPGIEYGNSEVERIVKWISGDVERGKFDVSLNQYRVKKGNRHLIRGEFIVSEYDLWVNNYINGDMDNPYYYNPRSLLERFGDFYLEDFLFKFNAEKVSPSTYTNRLYLLKRFFTYLLNNKKVAFNPLEGVSKRRSNDLPDEKRLPLD